MVFYGKRQKGFTLVELLIVVAILGILAAVVIPNVLGLMSRGGQQAYETDEEVIQLAVATFYSDAHAGFNPNAGTWCDSDYIDNNGHYYPTALGVASNHILILNKAEVDENGNPRIDNMSSGGSATENDISLHAIWMGLLINRDGDLIPVAGGISDRFIVSPIGGETGLYLQQLPESSCDYNSNASAEGSYVWIVGRNGNVYGIYQFNGAWYSGFSGVYP